MKKIKLFSGIKAKTTIFTIIPVIITYFIVSSVLYISLFNSQQNMAISEFQNITSRYTANFERKINNALDYLSSVTSILEFQVYEGAADREALYRIMYFIFDGHTVDSSSIYFEPDMYDGKDAEYINTEYGSALSGRISYYFYRYNGRTGYRQAAMDNDIEFTLPLYVDTKRLNAPTYTEPGIYNIDGVDMLKFVITCPIYGYNGEFIGVITADIFLGDIYTELQAEKIYETGYIIIANDKEQIIYSPRFEDIGKTRKEAGLLYPLPPDDITSDVFNAESIINNKKTLVSIQSTYFPQFDSRFYISVAAPVKEINASGERLLFFIVTFSITILILIALFLYYLISRLMKPLVEFTESANKIAYGKFNTRITGEYKDEFGFLKDTVNLMAERVENTLSVLQNILNGIDAYVFVTNPKTGEILFINEQMKEGFNIKGDIIGQYCYKIFQENTDNMCEFCPCHLLDINPGKPVLWEIYSNVTKRYYHNTDCYIEWIGGAKVHLQHSVDITDLKTITEEKFKAENKALELAQKKEHAEETSRMKSVFLANMSHEIRTPMNAILGVTELLFQNERLPSDIEEGLDKIYSSCDMLLGIINDILDFSKIEAGKLDIIPVKYKIASLINDSVNLNMMRIDTKPIGFELQIDKNIPVTMIGDELRIKQILNNLLSNAIKYTDAGKVTLSVESERDQSANDQIILVLSVRDTGHGMTDEQLGQMFEEYSRFNQEANISVEGTGLGLAITQRLISLMNGYLHVQSKLNKGSVFTVRLPQKTIDNEVLGSELADNLMHFRVNYMINRKRGQIVRDPMPYGSILVVDDVETNIYVAEGLLKLYKLQVDIAMSGQKAVELINEGKVYDVIFMDHMMPEMDGLEAVKILRSSGYSAPIVALTANAVLGQADMFLQNGFDDFISKPIDIRQLNSVLNRFVRDRQPPEVIEANRQKENKTDTNENNTGILQTDSLLLESFIRDGQKAISWLDGIKEDHQINNPDTSEALSLKQNNEDVLHKFIVIIHGMKSSLWNIGEIELANLAATLELSGRNRDFDMIAKNIPIFTKNLRELLDKLVLKQDDYRKNQILQDEDINDLRLKLHEILEKAADYNRKGVLDKLAEIKKYSKETKAVLDNIMEQIIHSNFEDVQNTITAYLAVISS